MQNPGGNEPVSSYTHRSQSRRASVRTGPRLAPKQSLNVPRSSWSPDAQTLLAAYPMLMESRGVTSVRSGYWYKIPLLPFGKMREVVTAVSSAPATAQTPSAFGPRLLPPCPPPTQPHSCCWAATTGGFSLPGDKMGPLHLPSSSWAAHWSQHLLRRALADPSPNPQPRRPPEHHEAGLPLLFAQVGGPRLVVQDAVLGDCVFGGGGAVVGRPQRLVHGVFPVNEAIETHNHVAGLQASGGEVNGRESPMSLPGS